MRVAQSECQRLKWQQPTVVFHFPQGVHQDVKLALQVRSTQPNMALCFDLPEALPAHTMASTALSADQDDFDLCLYYVLE